MNEKKISVADFLTEEEIEQAIKLGSAKEICSKIIEPNIDRINKAIGGENYPLYLAYMVEFVINQAKGSS